MPEQVADQSPTSNSPEDAPVFGAIAEDLMKGEGLTVHSPSGIDLGAAVDEVADSLQQAGVADKTARSIAVGSVLSQLALQNHLGGGDVPKFCAPLNG